MDGGRATQDGIDMPGKAKSDEKSDEKTGRDRRKFVRTSVLWSGTLLCAEEAIDCVITNMSANGAMVRLPDAVGGQSPYALNIPRFGDFPGKIAWKSKHSIGLTFLEQPRNVARTIEDTLPQCSLAPEL